MSGDQKNTSIAFSQNLKESTDEPTTGELFPDQLKSADFGIQLANGYASATQKNSESEEVMGELTEQNDLPQSRGDPTFLFDEKELDSKTTFTKKQKNEALPSQSQDASREHDHSATPSDRISLKFLQEMVIGKNYFAVQFNLWGRKNCSILFYIFFPIYK